MSSRYGWAAAAAVAGVLAVVAQEPALPQWQRVLKGDDAKRAAELEKQAKVLEAAGKRAEAKQRAEELLTLRVRVQGKDHWEARDAELRAKDLGRPLTADEVELLAERRSLTARAFALHRQGNARDALPLAERALAIARKVLGDGHPDTATSLSSLAVLNQVQGRLAQAEPLLREALAIDRKALGDAHPDTATTMANLGIVYLYQRRLADAEPLLREALAIRRKTLGDAHPDTARSLDGLGGLRERQGRLADAEPLYREALALRRKVIGDVHPDTATSLSSLGDLYREQGRLAEAEPLLREALAVRRKVLGDAHPDTAWSMTFLANLYRSQGKLADAEPLYREALAVRRKALGDAHPTTAQCMHNLGGLYLAQRRLAEAEPLYQEALAILRKSFGDAHTDTATSLNDLAALYRAQGKLVAAEPLLREVLATYRRALGDAHPHTARCLTNLAILYRALGRPADAEPLLRDAVAAAEAARLTAARGIDRAVADDDVPAALLAATLAARGDGPAAAAALEAGLARGVLDEIAVRRPVAMTPGEEARRDRLAADLARLRPRVSYLATKVAPSDPEREELKRLAADRLLLEGGLAELAAAVSRREVADLAAIRRALPADAAWVAWLDLTEDSRAVESWACVVRPAAEPRWVRLKGTGESDAITAADSSLPQRLQVAVGGDAEKKLLPASAAEVADLAKKLRDQRIAPALPHLVGVKTIYVSAVGHMAGVPVELLAPEFTVSYTPNGTFLAKLTEKARPKGDAVLAVGDPVFTRPGAAPAAKGLPPGGLLVTTVAPGGAAAKVGIVPGDVLLKYGGADLPDAAALQKAVGDQADRKSVPVVVWRENQKATATRDVDPGNLGVVVATDPAPVAVANRRKLDALVSARGGDWKELPGTRVELDRLRKLFGDKAKVLADSAVSEHGLNDLRKDDGLKRFRYLHLATHGEGNTTRAMESSLILAQDNLPGDLVAKEGEPLLDGRLTAREVLDHWKLDAELVTLSACETAVGVKAGGDGLLGFAQAFLTAGSRSVCLSLWRVDDTATALLMDRFYRNLLGRREGSRPRWGRPPPWPKRRRGCAS